VPTGFADVTPAYTAFGYGVVRVNPAPASSDFAAAMARVESALRE
jgi:hypothetical protein